jgi:peptide/nickel transport system substrate-binding protein
MQRRAFLRAAAGLPLLAAPRIAHAETAKTLKFIPVSDLVVLDPVWTGARVTRNHGYLVFDTLYGLDETLTVQPQMAAGHTIDSDGRRWTITLRNQLQFHDTEPVRARDVIASVRRFCARDGFGQSLLAVTDELSAPDDWTIVFRLKKPFPHLAQALAGSTADMPCIMPERLAITDPYKQVTEMVGSGPFRFLPEEHVAGSRTVYERFAGYVPTGKGRTSFLAGPKTVHFDRIEWITIPDPATAAAALQAGEVDWWELPPNDLLATLARNPNLRLATDPMQTAIGIMRFNHLFPPFDNPRIRRALLGAVDQAAAMQAVAGTDRAGWRDGIGLFGPDAPLANKAGLEVTTTPRNYAAVRKALSEAGYQGERIVALDIADIHELHAVSSVGLDELVRSGMNVDIQTIDFGTAVQRRASRNAPDQGGWNVFCTLIDGSYNFTPGGNSWLRGNGEWVGWPKSARLEELYQAWLDAPDLAAEKKVCQALQLQFWQDVPYIPMGQYSQSTCYNRRLTNIPKGFPLFYGARPA